MRRISVSSNVLRRVALVVAACMTLHGIPAGAAAPAGIELSSAYDRFGFALLAKLRAEQPGENVIVSPASVAIALAMTANGAGGTTRGQILKTLGVEGNRDIGAFDAANAGLMSALRNPGNGITFSIANALWLNPSMPVLPAFKQVTHDSFSASAQNVPMGEPSAADTINAWVKQNTAGMIPSIVDSTDPHDLAILTNAIAMKAKWLDPFEKNSTVDAPFTLASGKQKTVSLMGRTGTYAYAQDAGWQTIRLPYDDRFAMYVLLPREGLALDKALASLAPSDFDAKIAALKESQVFFQMPRYTATYRASLAQALSAMGMGAAFQPGADFSNMVAPPQKAYIAAVNTRTYVRVDEAGTEAAAATAVVMRTLAMRVMPKPIAMTVNRPFLMAIRDDKTRQILFLGSIASP